MKIENKIRLEIRKLVFEVFSKSMGLGSGFDDDEGQKPTKMHNWLGSKNSSRKPYTEKEVVEIIGKAMIDDDWDIVNEIYINLSTKNNISKELEKFTSMLGDAIHNNSWHELSVARKFLKDSVPSSVPQKPLDPDEFTRAFDEFHNN